MLEEIKNLNSQNVNEFTQKYGKINDIYLAQELLIISPNAWYVIDDSLKKIPEVMYFYQPVGYKHTCIESDTVGVFETVAERYSLPCGFAFWYGALVPQEFLTSQEVMEKFDRNVYLNIQSRIELAGRVDYQDYMSTKRTPNEFKNIDFNEYTLYDNTEHRRKFLTMTEVFVNNDEYRVFDRTKIREAVDEFVNKENGKKRVYNGF